MHGFSLCLIYFAFDDEEGPTHKKEKYFRSLPSNNVNISISGELSVVLENGTSHQHDIYSDGP